MTFLLSSVAPVVLPDELNSVRLPLALDLQCVASLCACNERQHEHLLSPPTRNAKEESEQSPTSVTGRMHAVAACSLVLIKGHILQHATRSKRVRMNTPPPLRLLRWGATGIFIPTGHRTPTRTPTRTLRRPFFLRQPPGELPATGTRRQSRHTPHDGSVCPSDI